MTKAELNAVKELRAKLGRGENDCKMGFSNDYAFSSESAKFAGQKITIGELVAQETHLWRATWILPVLDALIAKYDFKLNGEGEKPSGYNPITKGYNW